MTLHSFEFDRNGTRCSELHHIIHISEAFPFSSRQSNLSPDNQIEDSTFRHSSLSYPQLRPEFLLIEPSEHEPIVYADHPHCAGASCNSLASNSNCRSWSETTLTRATPFRHPTNRPRRGGARHPRRPLLRGNIQLH